jgi:hypothetical protein
MVLDSRDPALHFPDENTISRATVNPCRHVIPGSQDCQSQVDNKKCIFQQDTEKKCCGEVNADGANIEEGKRFVAVKKLEDHRSTQKGLGHLSDIRERHSSPVPFK